MTTKYFTLLGQTLAEALTELPQSHYKVNMCNALKCSFNSLITDVSETSGH